MNPVLASLPVALLFAVAPVHAQELQVTFTGLACPFSGGACQPYIVSFDLDTLSGHQQETLTTLNGVSYVSGFDSGPLSITNFRESFEGRFASVGATTGGISFTSDTASDFAVSIQNFFWDSGNPLANLPASQFSLANYLFGLSGKTLNSDGGLASGLAVTEGVGLENATIRVAAVPEPSALALMLAGLGGLVFVQSRRRAGRRRCLPY